jgi:3-hydroxypropanoate dehydrogenase
MLDGPSLDKIFRNARTHNGWLPKPVTDQQLRDIYEVMKWGPTSSNSQPIRIISSAPRTARRSCGRP